MSIFSGTNYLGISRNEAFQKLVHKGINQFGLHYGGSRFSNLCPRIFDEAERLLCKITGAEAAAIVSSGTMAGQLAISIINKLSRTFAVSDTHPALISGLKKSNLTFVETTSQLSKITGPANILCNGIDPLWCKSSDFSFVKNLDSEIDLYIDDSHGIGVRGKNGGSIFQELKPHFQGRLIVTASLGKALGVPGGVILSNAATIAKIKSLPGFGGAAPPPAAYHYAFVNGQDIYEPERQKLQKNIQLFRASNKYLEQFNFHDGYPVFHTRVFKLAEYLSENNIIISSLHYPTPSDDLITRVVINSAHQTKEIQDLCKLINHFFG